MVKKKLLANTNCFSSAVISCCIFCYILLFTTYNVVQANPNQSPNPTSLSINTQLKQSNLQTALSLLSITKNKNQIEQDKYIALQATQKKNIEKLPTRYITETMLSNAKNDTNLAQSNLDAAQLTQKESREFIDSIKLKISDREDALRQLLLAPGKTDSVKTKITQLQESLVFERSLLKIQESINKEIQKSISIYQATKDLKASWESILQKKWDAQKKKQTQEAFKKTELNLQAHQKKWLTTLARLNQNLESLKNTPINAHKLQDEKKLNSAIFFAQEKMAFIHFQIMSVHLENDLFLLKTSKNQENGLTLLEKNIQKANTIMRELSELKIIIHDKQNLLQQRTETADTNNTTALNNLLKDYKMIDTTLDQLHNVALDYIKLAQQQKSKALAQKQGLPNFTVADWKHFLYELAKMPVFFMDSVQAFKTQFLFYFKKLTPAKVGFILFMECLLLYAYFFLKKKLIAGVDKINAIEKKLKKTIFLLPFKLLKKNISILFIIIGIIMLLGFISIPFKPLLPIFYITIVWLLFKAAIDLSQLILFANPQEISSKSIILYKELKWALVLGGSLTLLTVLAHQLPVALQVTDFFNRIFMFFLFVTAVILLKNHKVFPSILIPYIEPRRVYFIKVINCLSLLIPLTILSSAILGIFGYISLAWTISRFEIIFLFVFSSYIIARGLLYELSNVTAELFIQHCKNGWLWRQALLRPLDKILNLGLLFLAGYFLFFLYGWTGESAVLHGIKKLLVFPIVNAKGLLITPGNILELSIAFAFIYWLSRWSREFSYRWFYSKTEDLGLRNSLAVVTQYTVFLVSIFIALKVIGINLGGISFVLAGFAAGIGLGLRDLVKNYASGLLLLFERPMRTGDLVTIGDCEGRVTHLGMRATTVQTWDHMEVLVPNSETFEKPITNWTHLDSIVRTVVEIKVSREDDPHSVQSIILSVLDSLTEVAKDPAPQVYLKEMSEALLNFEVRYYINLQLVSSRAGVRSLVLFSIFDTFKQQGIRAPYPVQTIIKKEEKP